MWAGRGREVKNKPTAARMTAFMKALAVEHAAAEQEDRATADSIHGGLARD
jgi:hypothetical protein